MSDRRMILIGIIIWVWLILICTLQKRLEGDVKHERAGYVGLILLAAAFIVIRMSL